MKIPFKKLAVRFGNKISDRIAARVSNSLAGPLAENIACRVALEPLLRNWDASRKPNDLFGGISDSFWFWLHTEGCWIEPKVRNILPAMPDENVQLMFTGDKGDSIMRDGFASYQLFRDLYEQHIGSIAHCEQILDFGCGWGRIIRFFLKDIEPSRLLGVDPVEDMVALCREQNKWCNFERIAVSPPSHLKDNTYGLIYCFSVFSHLSEEKHKSLLVELNRILKPGGLLIVTTRGREFIEGCAELRKRADLSSLHEGPRSSAAAFPETKEALTRYDRGDYCFSQLVHEGEWSYWGEAAIPKSYVLNNWGQDGLAFVEYIEDRKRCAQNVAVMKKAA